MQTVYTLREVAEILRTSYRVVYNEVKTGRLKTFELGGQKRVTREALEEFMGITTCYHYVNDTLTECKHD